MVRNISCQMLLLKMGCFDMSFLKQTLFTYMHLLITIFSLYKIRNYYTDRYKGLFMLIDFCWYIKINISMKKYMTKYSKLFIHNFIKFEISMKRYMKKK